MDNQHSINRWFNTYGLPQGARKRIFAFPHSGAGSSFYHQWAMNFDKDDIDFLGIQLPGRESRFQEVPFSSIESLLHNLSIAIKPLLDKPYVLFGHSLGALIAYELCRKLHQEGFLLPRRLYVSGFRSPELPNPNLELHELPDDQITEALKTYAGTPNEILLNRELMQIFLPLLRADFRLHETWSYEASVPLPCPITALSGKQDCITLPTSMYNWEAQTSSLFEHYIYSGDHFFLNQHQQDIIQHIYREL